MQVEMFLTNRARKLVVIASKINKNDEYNPIMTTLLTTLDFMGYIHDLVRIYWLVIILL